MKVVVAIPSRRRPGVLGDALRSLGHQRRPADEIWVAVTAPEDLPAELPQDPDLHVIMSQPGITVQRNAIIDQVGQDVDLLVFLDDDSELHPDYLAQAERFAVAHPDVVQFTGAVVVDGAATGEIDRASARRALAEARPDETVTPGAHGYGCNMAVRAEVARRVRFDERLPLYAWLEDRDFSIRVSRLGTVVGYGGCLVAHLGHAGGRENGVRLGFQQVVHPEYLRRKRVLSRRESLWFIGRAVIANLVRPRSSRIDRPGRLRGNVLGLREIVLGDTDPGRVLSY